MRLIDADKLMDEMKKMRLEAADIMDTRTLIVIDAMIDVIRKQEVIEMQTTYRGNHEVKR